MAGEILWERAGWASVFRQASWRPRVRVGRFDVEDATRPLAAALAERGLTYPSPSADERPWRNRCRFAHEGMCAVSWDGRVTPCLSLLHSHTEYINSQARRVSEFVVGHVDERPLGEIWRDPAFRAFRERVRAFDFPPCFHCGGCPLTETNGEDCYGQPGAGLRRVPVGAGHRALSMTTQIYNTTARRYPSRTRIWPWQAPLSSSGSPSTGSCSRSRTG